MQIDIIAVLAEHGIPVASFLPLIDGRYIGEYESKPFTLQVFISAKTIREEGFTIDRI